MRRALVLLLLAAPAFAQPTDDAQAQAGAVYQQGVSAFKAGDFQTALERFERAYKLDPSPILLYNLARAHQEMGHWVRSIENFEL